MELIGHKTTALFDLWSICHLISGIAVGNIVRNFINMSRLHRLPVTPERELLLPLLPIFVLAYTWEALEYALELGKAGDIIAYWFQGQEHWSNRFISDPLLVLAGYLLGRRFTKFIWPARMMLAAWLWIFIFIMPHSMAYF